MWNKVRVIFLSGLMVIANVMFVFAQDNPNCDGNDDPDLPCPIDNWVWVLVIVTLVIALIYWKRNKNSEITVA